MGDIVSDLKERFRRGSMPLRLLYVNVGVFVLVAVCRTVNWLFLISPGWPDSWLSYVWLPSNPEVLLRQPWSLVSYMFIHHDMWHLLFNMLCLYGFGQLFLAFFSAKHLRGVYFLGGFAGGLLFLLVQLLPIFQLQGDSYLMGASAAVLAIITAAAVHAPNHPVRLFLLGSIRMKYVAIGLIAISLISVPGHNSGGEIAHLGGALGGWLFTVSLRKGRDLTKWINGCLDFIQSLFDWKPRVGKSRAKKSKMKIHTAKPPKDWQFKADKKERDEEIDRILDKLKRSGYESLSAQEKKRLFDASKP